MIITHTFPGQPAFQTFVDVIESVYPESQWNRKKTETVPLTYLESCLVLLKDQQPIARASVYLNPDLIYEGHKTACIGHYECINDLEAVMFFHEELERYCTTLNATYIIGPMNGSTWENYRFNDQHTASLFLTEQLQQPYYNSFFTDYWNMKEISSYFSSKTEELDFVFEGIPELERYFSHLNVSIRSIDLDLYDQELEKLYPFLSEAFKTNFLYTPIEKNQFIKKYLEYKPLINKDFVLIAEDESQQMIGIIFCVQDVYSTQEKSLIIKTIARHPDKKWKGIGHLMGQQIYKTAHDQRFKTIIHAFMKTEGTSSMPSTTFLGTPFKTYTLYGKTI